MAAEVQPAPRYRVVASRVLLAVSVFGLALLHLLEPSYDSRTRTLSEYALSPSGRVFTLSMLSMAAGSALVLGAVWNRWPRRRWLLLVWVAGVVIVAALPTDPVGAVTTAAGTVHATAATLAIVALLIAEVATAFTAQSNRFFAGACALVVVAGLVLASLYGGGAGERVAVGAHIAWLLSIGGGRSAGGAGTDRSDGEPD